MKHEETLDPSDWDEIRKFGHTMIDDMIDYLRDVRERPIWKTIPESTLQFYEQGVPKEGRDLAEIYKDIQQHILAYPMGNIHPRFWGWVIGTGTIEASMADFMASVMNSNGGGGNHAANHIENQVIAWSKEMLGFPEESSGLITSGASMANLVGLTVARHHQVNHDIRKTGVSDHKLWFYGSVEMHSCIQKSIELLGIGYDNLVKIPVDDDYRVDTALLEKAIQEDLDNGLEPVCIIGNLGTVNTGAVDDLETLADLAEQYKLWFHVDGAFGAITRITPSYNHLAMGMERADSLAFDFHKWMYINYEAGCILIKHKKSHYQSFSLTPEYLSHNPRGVHGGDLWFSDYGIELSRGFKGLKIWTAISDHGLDKFGRLAEQNIEQAKYLTELVENTPQLELMAPTSMNIVCFRYTAEHTDLNALNEEILIRLHEQAIAVPSYTTLQGNYVIRVANTNHRSTLQDFDILVEGVVRIGNEIYQDYSV